jgi:hypothetical protein
MHLKMKGRGKNRSFLGDGYQWELDVHKERGDESEYGG